MINEKQAIIEKSIELFNELGIKFTILDIASSLNMSKSTIYKYFSSKDDLLHSAIDYVFEDIEKQHNEILNSNLNDVEKLRSILKVYPLVIKINDGILGKIMELYPQQYQYIRFHLATKWDLTINQYHVCVKNKLLLDIGEESFKVLFLGLYDESLMHDNSQKIVNSCVDVIFNGLINIP